METTPQMDAALSGDRIPMAGLFRLDTAAYGSVMLLDGSGVLKWGDDQYIGRHSQFGVLASMRAIEDGVSDQAPSLRMTLIPEPSAVDDIAWSTLQGSRVRLWIACYSMATGQVVPDPHPLFDGELDVATLRLGAGTLAVDLDCTSAFERLFEDDEWIRLNPRWLRLQYPDAAGLDHVTGVTDQVFWGQNPPHPKVTTINPWAKASTVQPW